MSLLLLDNLEGSFFYNVQANDFSVQKKMFATINNEAKYQLLKRM